MEKINFHVFLALMVLLFQTGIPLLSHHCNHADNLKKDNIDEVLEVVSHGCCDDLCPDKNKCCETTLELGKFEFDAIKTQLKISELNKYQLNINAGWLIINSKSLLFSYTFYSQQNNYFLFHNREHSPEWLCVFLC